MKAVFAMLFSLPLFINAQVYINVKEGEENPSAILQVDATNKGFQFPTVEIDNYQNLNLKFPNPIEGSVIYLKQSDITTHKNGFYVYQGSYWDYIGVLDDKNYYQDIEDNEFLGYEAYSISSSNGTSRDGGIVYSVTYNTINYSDASCIKWEEGNNHTYCMYKANRNINFSEAFSFAKYLKGYVVTITSLSELNFLRSNFLRTSSSQNDGFWLGYINYKLSESTQDIASSTTGLYRFKWITNEDFLISWDQSSATGATVDLSSFFSNISSSTSIKCTKVIRSNWTSNTPKASLAGCNDTNVNYVLVEFP